MAEVIKKYKFLSFKPIFWQVSTGELCAFLVQYVYPVSYKKHACLCCVPDISWASDRQENSYFAVKATWDFSEGGGSSAQTQTHI